MICIFRLQISSVAILFTIATPAIAQTTLTQCVQDKREAAAQEETKRVYSDAGCATGGTLITFKGKEYRNCGRRMCWPAASDEYIVDAVVSANSQRGSDYSHSGPQYEIPVEGGYKQVCVSVSARSGSGIGTRGVMNINLDVTTKRLISPDEMIVFMNECMGN